MDYLYSILGFNSDKDSKEKYGKPDGYKNINTSGMIKCRWKSV